MQKRKTIGNRPCVATYTKSFMNWITFLRLGVLSSDMFDWNDEEIANIIWGEAGESGDHIVPYPEREDDDGNNQESSNIKPAEHKSLGSKLDLQVITSENSPDSVKNGRISASAVDSWSNVASAAVAETVHGSLQDKVFSDSARTSKYLSKEECPLDGDSGAYDSLQGKGLSDFGEYDWDNIGSFDDLDRIFSNDEPLFSSVTLGNPNEIWSSSKEKTEIPPKSFDSPVMVSKSLPETSEKSNYGRGGQSLDLSFKKTDDSTSLSFQQTSEIMSTLAGGFEDESKHNLTVEVETHPTISNPRPENILTLNEFADKAYRQQTHLKVQKKVRVKEKGKSSQCFDTAWIPPANTAGLFKPQLSGTLSHAFLPSSLSQLNQVEGPEAFNNYQLIPSSYLNPSAFVNYTNPIAAMGLSPPYPPNELKSQIVFPGYEVTSANVDVAGKQLDSPGKAPLMTPREKIKKLRRRQQMQAMLAIQNQLQQFGEVPRSSIAQKSSLASPNQLKPGPTYEIDNLSALPSLDVASSIEQDESSPLSAAADGYSIEAAVLHRLQDVISKLDTPIRISIRDSLFRLVKSSVQRQQAGDVNITSTHAGEQHEVVVKEEHDSSTREVKVTDAETDTNPIDRAVAHFLFHRPMELSIKHPETAESSMSAKLNIERQAQGGANKLADSGNGLDFSSQGSGTPCQRLMDCLDASEPASDYSTLAAEATDAGASQ